MIFERFAGQLVVLARRRIGEVLRHKVDPEDVVQSTYKSFFHRYGDGELAVVNWNSLWGLLTRITLRKCAERVAYHRAECRDAAREASARPGPEDAATWPEALACDPTPLEAAELSETLERLLSGLDEDERPIVELSLQGYSTREVSEQLGRSERTVAAAGACPRPAGTDAGRGSLTRRDGRASPAGEIEVARDVHRSRACPYRVRRGRLVGARGHRRAVCGRLAAGAPAGA